MSIESKKFVWAQLVQAVSLMNTETHTHQEVIEDRTLFNDTVYTPLSEAIIILKERRADKNLMYKIENILHGNIPEVMREKFCAVQFRQIATPNNETRRFIGIAEESGLQPVLFEYHEDKFTSNNEYKHSLGQLHIQKGLNKHGHDQKEKITIVDFNISNGKKLREIKTLWNEPLIDFHRKLFETYNIDKNNLYFYEASQWLRENGGSAMEYYSNFFILFVCHGILFENFLISGKEKDFTEKVVLPAINEVIKKTGLKPLIVPFEPFDTEIEDYWIHHLSHIKNNIK